MSLHPYNINQIREMLDNNKELFESFFGGNMFDNQFFEHVIPKDSTKKKSDGNVGNLNTDLESNVKSIPMDLIQKKHEFVLILEIPGLNQEKDVMIKSVGSTIIIEGEIKRNYDWEENQSIKLERKIGRFSKKVQLPIVFDKKRIHAKYKNGLLEVRVPILKHSNTETISVHFQNDLD